MLLSMSLYHQQSNTKHLLVLRTWIYQETRKGNLLNQYLLNFQVSLETSFSSIKFTFYF
jgi:hypothetical protein